MKKKEIVLSKKTSCGHCNNISPMEIVGKVDDTVYEEEDDGPGGTQGNIYEVLRCPACSKITIVEYFWHDFMDSQDDVSYEILFPLKEPFPQGLPGNIYRAYEAADKIKVIDAEIYAIALRKVLELVCEDKKAKGHFLANKLQDLATRNEIPSNLVKVAQGLKEFGNIGAHAGIGDFSPKDIPIAAALCRAILEYIYSAPYIASIAEAKLNSIKTAKNKSSAPHKVSKQKQVAKNG